MQKTTATMTTTTTTKKEDELNESGDDCGDSGEVTPISLLFGGSLVSNLSYTHQAKATCLVRKQAFYLLPVEIQSSQVLTRLGAFLVFVENNTLHVHFS